MNKNNLHNIKNSGFKTPKGYFEGLEDRIIDQINLQNKIKDTGFKSPDNYFDGLEDKLLERVTTETKVISIFSKRNLIYATSIAAAIILILGIFLNKNEITFDNLETASIEYYLNEADLDSYEIASLLSEDELNTDSFTNTSLTEESIEDYLLENSSIEDLIIE